MFRILDLFSGAGGMSYGMEKNEHFTTEVALDFNEKALQTFKHNMPDTETVCGDITDEKIKELVLIGEELGYDYVTLDLEGFRSGSQDIKLEEK